MLSNKAIFNDETMLEIAKINDVPNHSLKKIIGKGVCLELLSYYGNRR